VRLGEPQLKAFEGRALSVNRKHKSLPASPDGVKVPGAGNCLLMWWASVPRVHGPAEPLPNELVTGFEMTETDMRF
jgi:hypothetical protein